MKASRHQDIETSKRGVGFAHLLGICILFFLTPCSGGQSRQIPAPPQSKPVILEHADIHTVTEGVIEGGYIIMNQGKIVEIGKRNPPQLINADHFDATGLHVYPGLIAASARLGLVETGAVPVTHDHNEMGQTTPEVRAAVAINPDTDLIPVARSAGILTALTQPDGGLVAGRAALIRMDGWTWENMTINDDAGLIVAWPRTEPITAWWMEKSEEDQRKEIKENLDRVEKFFDEAEAYVTAKKHDPTLAPDLRFEAMRPYVTGEKPIFVGANSGGQIEAAVAWAVRRGYTIIITGGHEADQVLPLLKEHNIPVIIGNVHRLPGHRDDDYNRPYRLPLILHEAGVRYCIAMAGEAGSARDLPHHAGVAAAHGLPKEEALKSITIHAAEILGVGDQLGSLEKGKQGTIIVTTGDPLEITTDVVMAFIDGRKIDLGNRQRSLYKKYKEKYRQLGILKN